MRGSASVKNLGLLIGLGAVTLLVMPGWADGIAVQPLDEHLNDAGCSFTLRKAHYDAYPVFIAGPDGAWMKLDGRKVRLTETGNPGDQVGRQSYQAGEYAIVLHFGRSREGEGGVSYPRARITVTRQGQSKTVPVSGGCGC